MVDDARHIHILLSTFDGARYLPEQLDSLLAQTYTHWTLYVRDDGSSDDTPFILRAFAARDPRIIVLEDTETYRLGATASYCALLARAPDQDNVLYAFCDQDDVWRPGKLAHAIGALDATDDPAGALYCSRFDLVDATLCPLGSSRIPRTVGFANALVENVATGCTVVFGARLRHLMLRADPTDMLMHDWWLYLCASAFGHVCYDPVSTVLYRRHDRNVTSLGAKRLATLAQRIPGWTGFLDGSRTLAGIAQAERFVARYPELAPAHRRLIDELASLRSAPPWARMCHALHPPVRRNDPVEQAGTRMLLLLGRY